MKTLLLIDASSLIYRCFHALPPLTSPDNRPIQAVYGLAMMLMRIMNDTPSAFAAALFDRPEPTFRKKEFAAYKAHRPPAPDELISQIVESHKLFTAFGIAQFEKPGYEADDLIATLVERFRGNTDLIIRIMSNDADLFQLVEGDHVVVETIKKGIRDAALYTEDAVVQRYGLLPAQLPDYKGFVGDASDNIPGVPGIGPKRAADLVTTYGTVERIYAHAKTDPALEKRIGAWKDQAMQSRNLALLDRHVPIAATAIDDIRFLPDRGRITAYFSELGFGTLVKRIAAQQRLL
ncbi:MAG: hypothetical protein HYS43_01005 [Candidatus Liptonbacteria bacterium]|nr:hypothetical protein [Candidatus Liptonbacteria bacterium]